MKLTTLRSGHREHGMVLIIAIGFLAILSILGAVVLSVATRDLSETAVVMPNQRALYAADRAVEYAMNRDIIMTMPVLGSIDLVYNSVRLENGTSLGVAHKTVLDASGAGRLQAGTVTDIGPRALPAHMAAIHGSEFGANLYHVNVTTDSGSLNINFKKPVHVDASIVRLFKMDDDQIFRTSGEGG